MTFTIEIEREEEGRWIAERLEHGEAPAELPNVSFNAA